MKYLTLLFFLLFLNTIHAKNPTSNLVPLSVKDASLKLDYSHNLNKKLYKRIDSMGLFTNHFVGVSVGIGIGAADVYGEAARFPTINTTFNSVYTIHATYETDIVDEKLAFSLGLGVAKKSSGFHSDASLERLENLKYYSMPVKIRWYPKGFNSDMLRAIDLSCGFHVDKLFGGNNVSFDNYGNKTKTEVDIDDFSNMDYGLDFGVGITKKSFTEDKLFHVWLNYSHGLSNVSSDESIDFVQKHQRLTLCLSYLFSL